MDSPKSNVPKFTSRETLQASYANLVRISHSPGELVFDFAQLLPGDTTAEIINRILMSPIGAKLFYHALGDNLKRFESVFGEIRLPGDNNLASTLFKGVHPPEKPTED
ncbi:MAG: DUF3467 domain-containing protein [Anaerolineaceae bacterium]|nr:DUF3467 domain-containing protein [Anaerolineaceae bacterium]MBN2677410.1 DUF3467 domain-containing protein [Anaerolineaceae bacterium]